MDPLHADARQLGGSAEAPETQDALINSSLIASCATLLALLLGTPAAYALARFRFELIHNRDLTIFFFSQRVLPPVATVIPFYLVMRTLGLLDTQLALILLNATFIMPFVVVILRQAFLDLPVELEVSALIDGADHWGAFWRIALPLVAPAIAATALIIFGRAWTSSCSRSRSPPRARSPSRSTWRAPRARAASSSGTSRCAR